MVGKTGKSTSFLQMEDRLWDRKGRLHGSGASTWHYLGRSRAGLPVRRHDYPDGSSLIAGFTRTGKDGEDRFVHYLRYANGETRWWYHLESLAREIALDAFWGESRGRARRGELHSTGVNPWARPMRYFSHGSGPKKNKRTHVFFGNGQQINIYGRLSRAERRCLMETLCSDPAPTYSLCREIYVWGELLGENMSHGTKFNGLFSPISHNIWLSLDRSLMQLRDIPHLLRHEAAHSWGHAVSPKLGRSEDFAHIFSTTLDIRAEHAALKNEDLFKWRLPKIKKFLRLEFGYHEREINRIAYVVEKFKNILKSRAPGEKEMKAKLKDGNWRKLFFSNRIGIRDLL